MQYILNRQEAKKVDEYSINEIGIAGMVLMERAALSVASIVLEENKFPAKILVVCGNGNNGGDGIAVARILYENNFQVIPLMIGNLEHLSKDLQNQINIAKKSGLDIYSLSQINDHREFFEIENIDNKRKSMICLYDFDFVIDGIFGIGLDREIKGIYKDVIDAINDYSLHTISIDIPSGIMADSGKILGTAIKADKTITFGYPKYGHILNEGAIYSGQLNIADIGFPKKACIEIKDKAFYFEKNDISKISPKRSFFANKGNLGKILIIAGSKKMAGAAILAAKAAYKTGAGMVKVSSVKENRDLILGQVPECLFSTREDLEKDLEWADVCVIGPGLDRDLEAKNAVDILIEKGNIPTIIDGDALYLLGHEIHKNSHIKDQLKNKKIIMTPHLKEMTYITDYSIEEIKNNPVEIARKTANDLNIILVQKDFVSIVAGKNLYINNSGNNGMATAGAGDVLTGIIAALIGQGLEEELAAEFGTYIHGIAGDIGQKELSKYSLMASDIITYIANSFLL